jgi:hypothetical protein
METRTITRSEAIALLRRKCSALVDDEHSLCHVAARLKILCGGFSQWKFHELKERYGWIARRRPGVTRAELEELANRWQLARQASLGTALSCDTQLQEREHRICKGWEGHSDQDLERFCHELTGEELRVGPDAVPGPRPRP